jgi:CheY-like chemotaxis protein
VIKKCIFVLDDDPSIVEVTQIILEECGYDVLVGQTESELYETLQRVTPDLILMDVWLSQTDGNQITRKLKSQESTASIPVILFSALNEIESITQKAGADGFLRKPYELDDLLAIVRKHTEKGVQAPVEHSSTHAV